MSNIQGLLKKMWNYLEEQKKNINQFYQSQQMTMTDLYRAKNCSEIIEKNIQRLNEYLEENKRINPNDRAELARNLNNISIQTNIIKATQQAMDDEIMTIRRRTDIQQSISGKMIHLKKDIEKTVKRAERIIKAY